MQKIEGKCPHCGKTKVRFEMPPESGPVRVDQSGGWYPLFKRIGSSEWEENWSFGIAVHCKCGRLFFMYDLSGKEAAPEFSPSLKEGLSLAWFCKKCGISFLNQDMTCPSCGTHY